MGGIGSGRHWYFGAKEATTDCRSIDARHWKKEGLLKPHQLFGWQWSCSGKCVASIRVRIEPDRVILTYRHRSYGKDWKDESYPVFLDWTPCHLGSQRPLVSLPGIGLRAVRGHPLRRHFRLPSLLPASLSQPAGNLR